MSKTHPIVRLLEGQDAITRYSHTKAGFSIAKNPNISNALNDLSSKPFTAFVITYYSVDRFSPVNDRSSFGSPIKPKVDEILKVAKKNQSKFGRGEKTVLDLDYRNGFEIEAKNLGSSKFQRLEIREIQEINQVLKKTLFVGEHREPTLKLYKMAVYQKGGHFDWHRDTTHGDNHHGTVLVALNTSWKGGELSLRHRGVESTFSMQPVKIEHKVLYSDSSEAQVLFKDVQLSVVAFYTDVEHKVNPVTEGVRIILQYDVYVPENFTIDAIDSDIDRTVSDTDSDEADMDADDDEDSRKDPYNKLSMNRLQAYKVQLPDDGTNEQALDRLVQALAKELTNPRTIEIGFPLRHLYRQHSILPQYLKGTDALIYQRLSEGSPSFTVSVCPIMLTAVADYETGSYSRSGASSVVVKCLLNKESDSNSDTSYHGKPCAKDGHRFYLYDAIDIRQISTTEYVEYTGNESQEATCKYFGGGIFLRKNLSKKGKKARK